MIKQLDITEIAAVQGGADQEIPVHPIAQLYNPGNWDARPMLYLGTGCIAAVTIVILVVTSTAALFKKINIWINEPSN